MSLSGPVLCLGILAAILSVPAPARADATRDARIAEIRERLEELDIQEIVRRSDIREIGGADTIHDGLRDAEQIRHRATGLILELEPAIEACQRSLADMPDLYRQMNGEPFVTPGDVTKEAAKCRAGRRGSAILSKLSASSPYSFRTGIASRNRSWPNMPSLTRRWR